MNADKITDKIKHLLSIAHDPSASEAEREQAMNRAHAWMLKHGIEVSHDENKSQLQGHINVELKGVYGESKATMLYAITLAYGSFDMILHKLPNTSSVGATIAGPEAQMKEIQSILDSLLKQSEMERKDFMPYTKGMPRSKQKAMVKSFYMGFGSRVAERIKDILEAEASQRDMQALVLMRDRATEHLTSMYDVDTKKRRSKTVDSTAFVFGQMAGDRAQINTAVAS